MASSLVEQCSPSARSAIIDPDHHQSAKVTQLHYSHPLVQLHRKFWLQSLQDVPENESMSADKDDDADEGEGEEDGPGFILKLGIPGIWRSELLVRKEYIRLYEYCDKYLESRRNKQKPPSVVITEQPGIGKSYWITYALCRRLAEGKPVFWFRSTARFLFVKEGVFEVPPDYHSTDLKTRVWLLIDADDSKDEIPDYLAPHETNHLIILCSSPPSARWKPLTRTTLSNDPRIDEMYYQYGPTPRLCLNFVKHDALFIEVERDGFRQKEFRHKCRISHPYPRETNFPTDARSPSHILIKLKLRTQLRNETRAARIALYKKLANVEGTRRIAGVVYESLAEEMLEERIALKLVPMVEQDSGRGKKFPRWHSNHGDGANRSLVLPIDISPAETFVYPVSGLDHPIKDRVYYIPETQNQVAFDSFIMAEGMFYIFQFATGSDQSINKGIVPFFSKMVPGALPPRADWHFVFIVPPRARSEIYCSQPRGDDLKLPDEMNLFSAVLDCEAE
ncbi:hypothetical protein EDB86DRAFT_2830389 [Lactarius hatsudake]|nr:hypothetical protein EDB86DRAFT_2830389 [Lactarius hatsudake]